MNGTLTFLGIAGSLRKGSYNRSALRAAQSLSPQDATLEVFDISDLPPFSEDVEQQPPAKIVDL
jgi:chromate reductase